MSTNQFGFDWGPMCVQRSAEIRGRKILRVYVPDGPELEITMSPQGQNFVVYLNGKRMKVAA